MSKYLERMMNKFHLTSSNLIPANRDMVRLVEEVKPQPPAKKPGDVPEYGKPWGLAFISEDGEPFCLNGEPFMTVKPYYRGAGRGRK